MIDNLNKSPISNRTRLEKNPYVTDVDEEEKRKDEDMEKMVELEPEGEPFGKNKENDESE